MERYYYLSFDPQIINDPRLFEVSKTHFVKLKKESVENYIEREARASQSLQERPRTKFYTLKSNHDIIFARYLLRDYFTGKWKYILIDKEGYEIIKAIEGKHSLCHIGYGKVKYNGSFLHELTSEKFDICKKNNKKYENYVTHHLGHNFDNRKNSLVLIDKSMHGQVHAYESKYNIIDRGGDFNIDSLSKLNNFVANISAPNHPIIPLQIQNEVSLYRQGKII